MEKYFDQDLFAFLKKLKKHNKRDWFLKNKGTYDTKIKEPMLRLITDLRNPLSQLSSKLRVDPKGNGGSMLRIYRDLRFSEDKSPYKTNVAAHFPFCVAGADIHTPGYYLHLEPGECFVGAGLWHPDSKALRLIRNRILDKPESWKKVKSKKLDIHGETLKKPPRGYDPEHPFIDDLKRVDFVAWVGLTEKQVQGKNFQKDFVAACKKMEPLMIFLVEALGYQW